MYYYRNRPSSKEQFSAWFNFLSLYSYIQNWTIYKRKKFMWVIGLEAAKPKIEWLSWGGPHAVSKCGRNQKWEDDMCTGEKRVKLLQKLTWPCEKRINQFRRTMPSESRHHSLSPTSQHCHREELGFQCWNLEDNTQTTDLHQSLTTHGSYNEQWFSTISVMYSGRHLA